jgi:hypothetical protein
LCSSTYPDSPDKYSSSPHTPIHQPEVVKHHFSSSPSPSVTAGSFLFFFQNNDLNLNNDMLNELLTKSEKKKRYSKILKEEYEVMRDLKKWKEDKRKEEEDKKMAKLMKQGREKIKNNIKNNNGKMKSFSEEKKKVKEYKNKSNKNTSEIIPEQMKNNISLEVPYRYPNIPTSSSPTLLSFSTTNIDNDTSTSIPFSSLNDSEPLIIPSSNRPTISSFLTSSNNSCSDKLLTVPSTRKSTPYSPFFSTSFSFSGGRSSSLPTSNSWENPMYYYAQTKPIQSKIPPSFNSTTKTPFETTSPPSTSNVTKKDGNLSVFNHASSFSCRSHSDSRVCSSSDTQFFFSLKQVPLRLENVSGKRMKSSSARPELYKRKKLLEISSLTELKNSKLSVACIPSNNNNNNNSSSITNTDVKSNNKEFEKNSYDQPKSVKAKDYYSIYHRNHDCDDENIHNIENLRKERRKEFLKILKTSKENEPLVTFSHAHDSLMNTSLENRNEIIHDNNSNNNSPKYSDIIESRYNKAVAIHPDEKQQVDLEESFVGNKTVEMEYDDDESGWLDSRYVNKIYIFVYLCLYI